MVQSQQRTESGNGMVAREPGLRAAPAPAGRPIMMAVEHATKYYKTKTGSVHALEDL